MHAAAWRACNSQPEPSLAPAWHLAQLAQLAQLLSSGIPIRHCGARLFSSIPSAFSQLCPSCLSPAVVLYVQVVSSMSRCANRKSQATIVVINQRTTNSPNYRRRRRRRRRHRPDTGSPDLRDVVPHNPACIDRWKAAI
jgi:hypothetical protein